MTTNAHKLQNYQISVKKKRITPKTIKTIEWKDSNKKCNGILLTLPQGKAARRGG